MINYEKNSYRLLSDYIVLNNLCKLFHFIFSRFISPIVMMRKLEPREVKSLT